MKKTLLAIILVLFMGLPGALAQQPMTQQEIDLRAQAQAQLNAGAVTAQAKIGATMNDIRNNPYIPADTKAVILYNLGVHQAIIGNQAQIASPPPPQVPVVPTHMIYIPMQMPVIPHMNIPDATTILLPTHMTPL